MSVKYVVDTEHNRYEVEKKLGGGAQGQVFELKGGGLGTRYIAKIFVRSLETAKARQKVRFLRVLKLDREIFALPLREISVPGPGYIAEMATGMYSLENLKDLPQGEGLGAWHKKTGGFKKRYECLLNLAVALRVLHGHGLIYGDMSPANVFVSEKEDKAGICLIDMDNLKYTVGLAESIYTRFYGAPEVVNGKAPLSTMSDAYSFAVMAYELLTLGHPLIGEMVSEGDPDLEDKALEGGLSWVEHEDETNRRVAGFPSKYVLAGPLRELFRQTFEEGLLNPLKRPSMAQWAEGLLESLNELLKCGNEECGAYYPYNNLGECPFCGFRPKNLLRIKVRLWAEREYDSEKKRFQSFGLTEEVSQEILLDENAPQIVRAEALLVPGLNPQEPILKIEELQDNNETSLRFTPLSEEVGFSVAQKNKDKVPGFEFKKKLDPRKEEKIKINRQEIKGFIHVRPLTESQRVLTIE